MSFKRQQTTEIAEALRDFGSFEKLKQSALIAAAFSLDESTVSGLRDAFNSIDTANNGRITKDELSKVGSVCVRCDGMSY